MNKIKAKKISHVAILVKDLEKTMKFFGDLLDTEFDGPFENKEADIRGAISPLGIELVTPLSPDGPTAKALERKGEGLVMLALEVTDIEKAIADMESCGVRLIGRPAAQAAQFHPKDLYGVMVELIQR